MNESKMQNFEKRRTLRRLWLERPANRRTIKDLMIFHEWLAEKLPSLLQRGGGDSYVQLKSDIGDLCEEERMSHR